MKIQLGKILCVAILALGLLGGMFGKTAALGNDSKTVSLNQQTLPQSQVGDAVPFSKLIADDIQLNGPYSSDGFTFTVPPSWRLTEGAQLNLFMTVAFSTVSLSGSDITQSSAGTLKVMLNSVVIGVVSLNQVGEVAFQAAIPPEALQSPNPDGSQDIRFILDSGWSCYVNQNTSVIIHVSSLLTLPHDLKISDTDLTKFPAPIYEAGSLAGIPALIVIPDSPTASELQAALTLAAGFGNISSSRLLMDITTVSKLTSDQISNMNLVLIGKAATNQVYSELKLPMPVSGGKFENSAGNPDDGIVEMVNSPWALDKVVLLVSGNTDLGTVKAAQAVSTGTLRPNLLSNVAVIDKVQTTPLPVSIPVDQSLGELGYKNKVLKNVGMNYATYKFYIPSGQSVSAGAYFDLYYGHSALLQFERSGIVLLLNSVPIGSVAFNKDTALQAVNHVQITIPPQVVLTGDNVLEIRVSLLPVDKCTHPSLEGVYANIWPDSLFHLPLQNSIAASVSSNYDLKQYPAPFSYLSTMDNTAFILQQGDLDLWRSAFQIAAYLGDRSNGPINTLSVFYGNDIPETVRAKYNFIVIGQPSKLPILSELNNTLPAPFDIKNDIAKEPQLQVKYRVSSGATVGYVEMLPSPWSSDNLIIAALGNNVQGVIWAASHLIEPASWKLAGNFAIINDQQVFAADTRLYSIRPENAPTNEAPSLQVTPPAIQIATPAPYRPAWLVPVLITLAVLILFTIVLVVYMYRFRNRARMKTMSDNTSQGENQE